MAADDFYGADRGGEEYGADYGIRQLSSDPRIQLLMRLATDGNIKYEEIENILTYTNEYDPPEKIIGMVVGVSGVAAKDVEHALAGTEWATEAKDIEVIEKSFDEYMVDLGSKARTFRDVSNGWFSWPMAVAGKGLRAAADAGIPAKIVSPLTNYYGDEEEANRADRTATRNAVRDEIDRLADNGYLNAKDAKRLRDRSGKYGSADYDFLITELNAIYEGMDPEDRNQEYGSYSGYNKVIGMLENRRGEREVMTGGGARATTQEDVVAPGEEEVNTVEVDGPDSDDGGFYESELQGTAQDGMPRDPQDTPASRPRAAYGGADWVYDRSTGQAYSVEEWTDIKTNPVSRSRYEKNKSISPDIQKTLDSLKQRGLPDINLAVPSLSPQNPWEVSTFDFKQGDGQAGWLAMTNRERYARLTQMKREGLISEKQFSDMGATESSWSGGAAGQGFFSAGSAGPALNLTAMSIWESAIGLSSTTQINPIAALSALGRLNREEQPPPPRGGSGRVAPRYSVPASLREIPDYKTLATETKGIFGQQLGRDLEDWELALLADEMKQKYTEQQRQRISIHKTAWNEAQAGGTVDVDFTEVEDPQAGLQYDIEERYANELDRQERVEDRANNNRLLMDSISVGKRMI